MLNFLDLSFHLTYFFLIGSSIITYSEMFTYYPPNLLPLKYILSLETGITIIAAIAYNNLINIMKQPHHPDIISFRYLDWFCTTPLLLLSFIIYMNYLTNKYEAITEKKEDKPNIIKLDHNKIIIIIILNLLMLFFGFLGENKYINHVIANILGFIPFIIIIYLLWKWYQNKSNTIILNIFTIIWTSYGFVYFLPTIWKNLFYNLLDIISKCGFGILVWYELINQKLGNPNIIKV